MDKQEPMPTAEPTESVDTQVDKQAGERANKLLN